MTTERAWSFMLRHFGSHERPAVLYAMWCRDSVTASDGTELDIDLDDDGVSLDWLVADAWVGRNEKMGNIAPNEWVALFDDCVWPLGDDGDRASIPPLPLSVYRAGHPDGMSWTTSLEVAHHFHAMCPHNAVYRCSVTEPLDLLAIFHGRREHEVVLRPQGTWRATVAAIVSPSCHDDIAEA